MDNNRWWTTVRRLLSFLMAAVLTWGMVGCSNGLPFGKRDNSASPSETPQALNNEGANSQLVGQLSEVAPPPVIQKLSQSLEAYQPQVLIVSPTADEVVQDTTVSAQFQVRDLPIFKDPDLGMGPHLHVILDNQPYQAVYDLDQPLVFEDLRPGTHTLRVFASRPWHESFKNEGAYAQTTFHVFTKSTDNNPAPELPLLTYSRPTGSYGAEPIMLDFYLTNAPLHLVAQENPDDDIADWRIRVTINGESFVLDRWQSVYLKGFKQGKNWVKLEFIDEQGNPVKNVFNDTVRVISYEPQGKDTLAQLVRSELSAEAAGGIVDPNYKAAPTPTPSPAVTPSPTVTPEPIPSIEATPEETPTPEPETPAEEPTPPAEALPTPEPQVSPTPSESPTAVEQPTSTEEATPAAPVTSPKPWFKGFFNPFRRPTAAPSPAPARTEQEAPSPAPAPEEPQQTPEPEALPTPSEAPATVEEPTPTEAATPTITPSESPASPEGQETPPTEPTVAPETPEAPAETTPQPEESPSLSESPAVVEEPTPAENPTPKAPATIIKSWFKGFFNPFRQPTVAPSPAPEGLEQEIPPPVPAPAPAPEEPQQTPELEALPTPSKSPATVEEPTPIEAATPTTTSSKSPASPEVLEPPSTEPIVVPETTEPAVEIPPQPEESLIPSEPATAVEEPTPSEEPLIPSEPPSVVEEATPTAKPVTPQMELPPVTEAVPVRPIQPEQSKADGLPPTLPEIVETPSL